MSVFEGFRVFLPKPTKKHIVSQRQISKADTGNGSIYSASSLMMGASAVTSPSQDAVIVSNNTLGQLEAVISSVWSHFAEGGMSEEADSCYSSRPKTAQSVATFRRTQNRTMVPRNEKPHNISKVLEIEREVQILTTLVHNLAGSVEGLTSLFQRGNGVNITDKMPAIDALGTTENQMQKLGTEIHQSEREESDAHYIRHLHWVIDNDRQEKENLTRILEKTKHENKQLQDKLQNVFLQREEMSRWLQSAHQRRYEAEEELSAWIRSLQSELQFYKHCIESTMENSDGIPDHSDEDIQQMEAEVAGAAVDESSTSQSDVSETEKKHLATVVVERPDSMSQDKATARETKTQGTQTTDYDFDEETEVKTVYME